MSDTAEAIKLSGLTKHFRSNKAVDGVDLVVEHGTFHALLGPNGAGKTTLLQTMVKLLHPTSGHGHLLGTPLKKLSHRDFQKIGYISEGQDLPERVAVRTYLDSMRSFYPSWDRDLEAKLIKELDLPTQPAIRNLSRGQRMKVQLISSLAFSPQLILMDEPLGGLDPLMRHEVLAGLLELLSTESPPTVLISSHDVDEIEHVATHISYMAHGKIAYSASVEQMQNECREISLRGDRSKLPDRAIGICEQDGFVRYLDPAFTDDLPAEAESANLSLKEVFHYLARESRAA